MRAFAFYSPKVTGEQRNSFGSRAFSGTLNGCLLIGGFPGGVYTGLREFERYMAICGGMGGWDVFVLGAGSFEPGAEECAQLLSQGRWITRSGVQDQPGQCGEAVSTKNTKN